MARYRIFTSGSGGWQLYQELDCTREEVRSVARSLAGHVGIAFARVFVRGPRGKWHCDFDTANGY